MFTILVAVDFHQKCNFEFNFPAVPTITELRDRLETVLSTEAALRRPPGVPVTAFSIHRIQVFDERMEMWVDLVSSSQLADYCQIYVFQRESPWHKDAPGRIPPPVRPSQPLSGYHSPMSHSPHQVSPMAAPLMSSESVPRHNYGMTPGVPGSGGGFGGFSGVGSAPGSVGPALASSPPVVVESSRVSPQRSHPAPPPHIDPMEIAPELITHAEKVRVVYDELDFRKQRAVSFDDWNSVFTKLRISQPEGPFSLETTQDLFHQKADRNQDGFVSFTEFQMFAEMYPKLLDSLYFRCRDQVHHDSRAANMDAAEQLQADLERRRDDAEGEWHEAESTVLAAQQKEDISQSAVDAAREHEKDARAAKDDAHAQTEEVRVRLREAQGDRDRVKEQVRQRDSHLRTAQRSVDTAMKKHKNQENELDKARKELERLQRLVEQQMREVERQEGLVDDAAKSIDVAHESVAEQESAKNEVEGILQGAQEKVQGVEDELRGALDHENQLGQAHRDAVKEVNQMQGQKAQEEQDLTKAKAKEAQKKAQYDRAMKALEEHEKVLEALRAKDRDLQDRRHQEELKENEILEAEVRLREQRECMEQKEAALRTAHLDFTNEAGRGASPVRGTYHSNLSA